MVLYVEDLLRWCNIKRMVGKFGKKKEVEWALDAVDWVVGVGRHRSVVRRLREGDAVARWCLFGRPHRRTSYVPNAGAAATEAIIGAPFFCIQISSVSIPSLAVPVVAQFGFLFAGASFDGLPPTPSPSFRGVYSHTTSRQKCLKVSRKTGYRSWPCPSSFRRACESCFFFVTADKPCCISVVFFLFLFGFQWFVSSVRV